MVCAPAVQVNEGAELKDAAFLGFQAGRELDSYPGFRGLRLWGRRLVPLHLHLGGNGSVTLPTIHAEIEVAGVDDGQIRIGRGENRVRLGVKLEEQGASRSGRQRQVRFLTGGASFTRSNGPGDMNPVCRLEIEAGVGPDVAGSDRELIVFWRRLARSILLVLGDGGKGDNDSDKPNGRSESHEGLRRQLASIQRLSLIREQVRLADAIVPSRDIALLFRLAYSELSGFRAASRPSASALSNLYTRSTCAWVASSEAELSMM
jgi:hypothetical protein